MTKKNILIAALMILIAGPAVAELQLNTRLAMADIENDRKTIVLVTIDPSPEQSKKFWEAYDAYRANIRELDVSAAKMMEEYVASYASLNDEQAKRMLKEFTKIESKRVEIRSKAARKLGKILTAKQVLRWLQTENKMDAVTGLAAAIAVPMNE